jgi:class 3 adenylate cyclase/general stress protein CsbA
VGHDIERELEPESPAPPTAPETVSRAQTLVGDPDRLRLRFRDRDLERGFQTRFANHNVTNVRVGHVLGVALWLTWGFMVRNYLRSDGNLDQLVRYGVLIPLTVMGFALTFLPSYPRFWKWPVMAALLITSLTWTGYVSEVRHMPADYGYVGLILIQTFAFTILRLPFALVVLFDVITIPAYFAFALGSGDLGGFRTLLAIFYLGSFSSLGLIASYVLEWKIRHLFLREQELDLERARSDTLLLNILPQVIIDRLKRRRAEGRTERLADALDDVTVLFIDAVGFTVQTGKTQPAELVRALDELFCHFDDLADRYGLEKIKTIGDAYMAVAGVPTPRPDHADAAAQMAIAILDEVRIYRWPSDDPITVRVGMASGPAVAGVIGQRKFAYDLWGDTVNLASRLESNGQPGRILASESVVSHLQGRYEFGPPMNVDLKGKGLTAARFLLHRAERTAVTAASSAEV